jgi:hypothetical protein
MPVTCTCKQCGGSFETYPAEIKKGGGKFCCPDHYHKWISENKVKSGKNSNLWKGAKVDRTCKQCGSTYKVYNSQIKWRGSNFCSRKCRSEWISEQKSGKKSWNWVDKVKRICPVCGKEFEENPSNIKRGNGKYCSNKCYGVTNRGSNNFNWNGGTSFGIYCYKFNQRRKRAVRNFFNNLCICCGRHVTENIVKYFGQINLSVHHIDHDKDQGCNGRPFNLVPLCNECHAQELNKQEDFKTYINKTLEDGFKWGIWSKEEYEVHVMYPEDIPVPQRHGVI